MIRKCKAMLLRIRLSARHAVHITRALRAHGSGAVAVPMRANDDRTARNCRRGDGGFPDDGGDPPPSAA